MKSIDMYKENVIENFKNPKNFGELKNPSKSTTVYNEVCGDLIRMQVNFEKNKIKDIKFKGSGCALSIASSSLFTEFVKGKEVSKLKNLGEKEILDIIKIPITSSRIKCVLMPLFALRKLLNEHTKNK